MVKRWMCVLVFIAAAFVPTVYAADKDLEWWQPWDVGDRYPDTHGVWGNRIGDDNPYRDWDYDYGYDYGYYDDDEYYDTDYEYGWHYNEVTHRWERGWHYDYYTNDWYDGYNWFNDWYDRD